MFDAIAAGYDRMNAVMTFGQERRWRRIVADTVAAQRGDRVLDLAAGTAASTAPLARGGATAVGCDFSLGMLAVGRSRQPRLPLVAGDALRLPFRDGAFDAVTISFGLRNVADVDIALRELARVTVGGGRLVILETSTPASRVLRAGHRVYVNQVLPRLARAVVHDGAAYDYLAESVGSWPPPAVLAERLRAAGWDRVSWRTLLLGAVALHVAHRSA